MSKEAMKLALEVMQNQGDVSVDEWIAAEEALQKALANEALDRMAENERELGIQMQPTEWLTGCPSCGMDSCDCDEGTYNPPAQQDKTDWEAVAADQAMTIALLKAELQEFANKEADAVEVALTESGWVWDGDQWQRPPQTWIELDHDDIHALMNEFFYQGIQPSGVHFANFARAIETKLKEKNNG